MKQCVTVRLVETVKYLEVSGEQCVALVRGS